LAPNNASAWNYFRGVLDHTHTPYSEFRRFVQPYAVQADPDVAEVVDLDNPLPSKGSQLPCVAAIEFLADIHEGEGGDGIMKATEVRGVYASVLVSL
jgi:protein farnesyltransferase/geranylgeranyltransferase type-1 subunit alpha